MPEKEEKVVNTLKVGVYTIYDTVLKQFEPPFSLVENQLTQYMSLLVNDVQSRFYGKESDFILNKIAEFSQESGEINIKFIERVAILDSYIDRQKRTLQEIMKTLNYLPSGYYKMPDEQKKVIQEQIDEAIIKYVSNYVIPDLDLNKLDTHNEKLKEVIKSSFCS